MTTIQSVRHSQVWVWTLICVLAMLLVLAVFVRVAADEPIDPPREPETIYIVSPFTGTFVAGQYRGAEPYVSVGSKLEPDTVIGNIEVWRTLRPVRAMVRGTVIEVLVLDEALVVPRQPLLKVRITVAPTPV